MTLFITEFIEITLQYVTQWTKTGLFLPSDGLASRFLRFICSSSEIGSAFCQTANLYVFGYSETTNLVKEKNQFFFFLLLKLCYFFFRTWFTFLSVTTLRAALLKLWFNSSTTTIPVIFNSLEGIWKKTHFTTLLSRYRGKFHSFRLRRARQFKTLRNSWSTKIPNATSHSPCVSFLVANRSRFNPSGNTWVCNYFFFLKCQGN